jgi:hypothetical protein
LAVPLPSRGKELLRLVCFSVFWIIRHCDAILCKFSAIGMGYANWSCFCARSGLVAPNWAYVLNFCTNLKQPWSMGAINCSEYCYSSAQQSDWDFMISLPNHFIRTSYSCL